MKEYRHFVAIVVGDNPEEILSRYDANAKQERHIVYKLSNAENYYKSQLQVLQGRLAMPNLSAQEKTTLLDEIAYHQSMDPLDFYLELTEGYEIDETTGDAYSTFNEDSKFDGHNIGRNFSNPFILKDGQETFSASKGDIDWDKIHLYGAQTYVSVWETVMEGRSPANEDEQKVFDNMKNRKTYLELFGNKDTYVISNTAFWGFAYVDEDGWFECGSNQFEWMSNFYDRFIKPLSDDANISIYECTRTND